MTLLAIAAFKREHCNTSRANDCHIANLVIINGLVGAGLSISRWASEIAGKPAPTKCDIRKTTWYNPRKMIEKSPF